MNDHYQEELLPYYLRELAYLREMGAAFRERYPRQAARLDVGDHESTDPHVERLLESFAFLTGRIQYNLEAEFPEIPSALLAQLYPHLQAPVPSMAIAAFEVDLEQGVPAAGQVIGIPHLAPLEAGQLREMGVSQDPGQRLAVFFHGFHGAHYRKRTPKGEPKDALAAGPSGQCGRGVASDRIL